MSRRRRLADRAGAVYAACLGLAVLSATPASAQYRALVLGTVQDIETNLPIEGAILLSADGASSAVTDRLGNFALQVAGDAPYGVSAVAVGYQTRRFDLPASARTGRAVLSLEPAPVATLLRPRDRIRIASDEASGDFVVMDVRDGTLVVRPNPTSPYVEVPATSLRRLEIHRGREVSRPEGVFGGAAFGGLIGLALGLQCGQTHYDCITGVSLQPSVLIGAGLGAVVGFFVSGASDDAWEEVRLPGAPIDDQTPLEFPRERAADAFVGEPSLDGVELVVRNQLPGPVTAFIWWEGRRSSVLGEVGAGSVRTFRTDRASLGIALFVEVLSDPDLNPRREWLQSPRFVPINVGDRVEWTVLRSTSGLVEDVVRSPRR